MGIEQILQITDIDKMMTVLTAQRNRKPLLETLEETERQYDPMTHKVMDKHERKDKRVKVKTGELDHKTGEPVYKQKTVPRCRVSVPMQRILVERNVGFLFGIPVEYKMTNNDTEGTKQLFDMIMDVFHDNKMQYFDKKLARTLFRCCECAELWYYLTDNDGKPTDMHVKLLSPLKGDALYPHFDEYDRMDGFARRYTISKDEGGTEQHFDVYTDTLVFKYVRVTSGWTLKEQQEHGFSKIPVIYYRQEETEWHTVQPVIERIEELLSNWGDTNDYFGTPSYFCKGKLTGFAEKGEVGRVYQGEGEGADMKVMSWDSSPQSISGELTNLINIVFSYTQTPDVSFETMKTLGNNTSGVALKLMFTDPHMKADMKIETFGEMFTRRFNLLKSGITTSKKATLKSVVDSLRVEPVFTPYLPKNEIEELQVINACTGGKPTMSQKEGVRQNPRISNPDLVLQEIQEEAQAQAIMDAFGQAE